ncbi:MAG: FAD-dependent oxidoreductase [Actinocrinis sp.]
MVADPGRANGTTVAADVRERPPALAIVGAGPAGLAAAVVAAEAGIAVTVLDSAASIGGQFYRQPARGLNARRPQALHHAWRNWTSLRARFVDHASAGRISHLAEHHVWFVERSNVDGDGRGGGDDDGQRRGDFVVYALTGPEQRTSISVHADALLLATGSYERVLPFPGWTLPGVVTAGGAQAMLKGTLVLPGRDIVVAGTGPLLLPVATGLADAGARVRALIESADARALIRSAPTLVTHPDKLGEAAGYAVRLARHRVPIHYRHTVIAAHGTKRVEAVTVAALDRDGHVRAGSPRRIACDSLAIGHGLLPHLDLALSLGARIGNGGVTAVWVDDEQRTDVPGLWAAGESTGIGGAALAQVEGQIAGRSIAARLRGTAAGSTPGTRAGDPSVHVNVDGLAHARDRMRAFFAAIDKVYTPPETWVRNLTDDTTVCRCEEVPVSAVREAVRELGAGDLRTVKLLTRAGMGWCQGRVCGPAVAGLLADCRRAPDSDQNTDTKVRESASEAALSRRPFARPVPLGVLARLVTGPDDGGRARDPRRDENQDQSHIPERGPTDV